MRAVVFDMDGTLVDSEPAYAESDRRFFSSWGLPWDDETNARFLGRSTLDLFLHLETAFPGNRLSALPLAERLRLRDEAYLSGLRGRVPAFPSTAALARRLSEAGIPIAIASGSSPAVIEATLADTGLAPLFRAVVSAEELPRGKPAPDVFLEAARRLGVEPAECLVLEDAPAGLAAAKAAGMGVIALPAPGSELSAFSAADRLVPGGPAAIDLAALLGLCAGLGLEALAEPASLSS